MSQVHRHPTVAQLDAVNRLIRGLECGPAFRVLFTAPGPGLSEREAGELVVELVDRWSQTWLIVDRDGMVRPLPAVSSKPIAEASVEL